MIKFRKLLVINKEEGLYDPAIISYKKIDWTRTSGYIYRGDRMEVYSYVSKYKIYLDIDFLFFIINLSWVTKETQNPYNKNPTQ